MKDEDRGTSSAFAFVRGGDGRHLRRRVDRVWSGARQDQVRWFVSWDVRWIVCGQPREGIRRIFRSEWCHYRDRSRSGRGNRGFFWFGDFRRFTRGGECHLQVYWRLPVLRRRAAERSPFGFMVVCGVRANRKGHVECGSTVSEFDALHIRDRKWCRAGVVRYGPSTLSATSQNRPDTPECAHIVEFTLPTQQIRMITVVNDYTQNAVPGPAPSPSCGTELGRLRPRAY